MCVIEATQSTVFCSSSPRKLRKRVRNQLGEKSYGLRAFSLVRSHFFFTVLLHKHICICKNHSPLLLESLDDENSFPTALLEKYITFKKSVSSKRQLIGKVPDAGKDRGQKEKRESEDEMGITDAVIMNLGKLWEMVKDREASRAAFHAVTESDMTGRLNNKRRMSLFNKSCNMLC